MPKLYEYFGLIFLFYSQEHEPIHIHAFYGEMQLKAEFIIEDGIITKIMDFGAFVEILPGKEGLLHISQIDNKRVNKVTDYFKEGDKVTVKLLKVENGKFSLSRKDLLKETSNENKTEAVS